MRMCGTSSVVARCPLGCYGIVDDLANGAYVARGRLGQVALESRRVVRSWRLPAVGRDRISLVLTRRAVYASLLVEGRWKVFRGELA